MTPGKRARRRARQRRKQERYFLNGVDMVKKYCDNRNTAEIMIINQFWNIRQKHLDTVEAAKGYPPWWFLEKP